MIRYDYKCFANAWANFMSVHGDDDFRELANSRFWTSGGYRTMAWFPDTGHGKIAGSAS